MLSDIHKCQDTLILHSGHIGWLECIGTHPAVISIYGTVIFPSHVLCTVLKCRTQTFKRKILHVVFLLSVIRYKLTDQLSQHLIIAVQGDAEKELVLLHRSIPSGFHIQQIHRPVRIA